MTDTISPEIENPPAYRLFDANGVFWAALIGGPWMGIILLGQNYKRSGNRKRAFDCYVVAFFSIIVTLGLGWIISEVHGPKFIGFALAYAVYSYAKASQRGLIAGHRAQGGAVGSRGLGAAFGLLSLVPILLTVAGVFLVTFRQPQVLQVFAHEAIYYEDGATVDDARKLVASLKAVDYSDGDVCIRGVDNQTIDFVLQDRAWNKPAVVNAYEAMTYAIAHDGRGFKQAHFGLCDDNLQEKVVLHPHEDTTPDSSGRIETPPSGAHP